MATRYTNYPNGVKTWPRADNTTTETATHTLTAAECVIGATILHDAPSAIIVTLPILSGVKGGQVTIVNINESQLFTINPNDADGIAFGGNVTNGKSIVNTAATAKKGDFVTLCTDGGILGDGVCENWTVAAVGGIWADGA